MLSSSEPHRIIGKKRKNKSANNIVLEILKRANSKVTITQAY